MRFEVMVIAMPREKNRRAQITKSLKAVGIEKFHFLDATDGRVPEQLVKVEGYDEKKARQETGRLLTPSEIACFDSHRRSWEWISGQNKPVLVLESDAQVTEDTIAVCEKLCEEHGRSLPAWQHVMLYYHECLPSFWDRHKLFDRYRLVRFANNRAYISSTMLMMPEAAKNMLKKGKEIVFPVDNYMTGGKVDKKVNIYAVYPPPAELSWTASFSSIEAERSRYRRKRNGRLSFKKWSLPLRQLWRKARPYRTWL